MPENISPAIGTEISGVARGAQALALAYVLQKHARPVVYVCAGDREMSTLREMLRFFLPDMEAYSLPAWDCLPYDRVSPRADIMAERIHTLTTLSQKKDGKPFVLLTTVNAVLQKLPPHSVFADASFALKAGSKLDRPALLHYFTHYGYRRVEKVVEPGEFAVRGSIIDLICPGEEEGLRLDLFGDDLETIRRFDPLTQISSGTAESVLLKPMNEVILSAEAIERFRIGYRDAFGAVSKEDPLYEAISHGRSYPGMEHWLPLFYENMETIADYAKNAIFLFDHQTHTQLHDRLEIIEDYYQARVASRKSKSWDSTPYKPLPADALYLNKETTQRLTRVGTAYSISPFQGGDNALNLRSTQMQSLTALRGQHNSVFDALRILTESYFKTGKHVWIGCYSSGSLERLQSILQEHEFATVVRKRQDMLPPAGSIGLALLPIEQGFETPDSVYISEQDIFGERIYRAKSKRSKTERFMEEASNLTPGELVVHREHGIARFEGLVTLEVNGAQHDCLKLIYDGDDKLFVPVENIEVVSHFGSDHDGVKLDKLGGVAWQERKARLKERIKIAAEELLRTAALRALRTVDPLAPPQGLYDEFCARFPYVETEDQARAIGEVLEDLASGRPTDRLICGDVGFGKTEVALRAAFVATSQSTSEGKVQVAVVCPTTLLCRQHFRTFTERFQGMPINIAQLSRMVSAKQAKETLAKVESGEVDIVIGTHALLQDSIKFKNLGLLVIDEEQHFGVGQKEKLKKLKSDVHVVTLSATPIPRTLQLSLSGVRELSLITTPPVDRLAVRTYVIPFDAMILREAILREHHRGGKIFYVTPRIKYIADLQSALSELVPEVRVGIAHGQMTPNQLDTVMNDFYDNKFEVLLCTSIVESGLDIPSANTIIIDRANLFGLSQLYQLRGRVGRGKIRAYAYFTLPHHHMLSDMATRRLEVMQSLDTLGAGFSVASHDMDIRGFGNLLGEEQSGQVKEVGIELYQQMLQDAVEAARQQKSPDIKPVEADEWSPQINLGTSVLIPESYVADLQLRLSLYRRVAHLHTEEDIHSFASELADRFGPLPEEVNHLLAVLHIKHLCMQAGIERVDVGPKGAVISFRQNRFANPEKLLGFIAANARVVKLRPDHKLVVMREWESPEAKLKGVGSQLAEIARLAA